MSDKASIHLSVVVHIAKPYQAGTLHLLVLTRSVRSFWDPSPGCCLPPRPSYSSSTIYMRWLCVCSVCTRSCPPGLTRPIEGNKRTHELELSPAGFDDRSAMLFSVNNNLSDKLQKRHSRDFGKSCRVQVNIRLWGKAYYVAQWMEIELHRILLRRFAISVWRVHVSRWQMASACEDHDLPCGVLLVIGADMVSNRNRVVR